MGDKDEELVPAETFEEVRDKKTGRYVSDEEAEGRPDEVTVEEFVVLREKKDVKP